MTKTLIRLIDKALIPASLMICGKVFGLWWVNSLFNLNWGIESDPNKFFSVKIVYTSIEDKITATSYSNLTMYIFVLFGFVVILIRALFFHSSHISPKLITLLSTNNLLGLVKNSFEIYNSAIVWIIILWLSFLAVCINVFKGDAFLWTLFLTLFTTLAATTLLFSDVKEEIEILKKKIST